MMVLLRVASLESGLLIGGGSNAWPHDITNTGSPGLTGGLKYEERVNRRRLPGQGRRR